MNGTPHHEVINAQPKALIVGFGHVGKQIARYFNDAHYVDIDGEKAWLAVKRFAAKPKRVRDRRSQR